MAVGAGVRVTVSAMLGWRSEVIVVGASLPGGIVEECGGPFLLQWPVPHTPPTIAIIARSRNKAIIAKILNASCCEATNSRAANDAAEVLPHHAVAGGDGVNLRSKTGVALSHRLLVSRIDIDAVSADTRNDIPLTGQARNACSRTQGKSTYAWHSS